MAKRVERTREWAKQAEAHSSSTGTTSSGRLDRPHLRLQRTIGNQAVQRLIQAKDASSHPEDAASTRFQYDVSPVANHTGLPGPLKAGLEALSGVDLSGVRVHRNSARPAQVNAVAYTQGQHIHVGPGEDQHLAHEGWHAVQQMQGRVQPTLQAKGVSINDETELEREADVMGAKASRLRQAEQALPIASSRECATSIPHVEQIQASVSQHPDTALRAKAGDAETHASSRNIASSGSATVHTGAQEPLGVFHQRGVGELKHGVQELDDSTQRKVVFQLRGKRKPDVKRLKRAEWDKIVTELSASNTRRSQQVLRANNYLSFGIPVADDTRYVMNEAASSYQQAYTQYKSVIDRASKEALSRQDLLNTFVGIGVGVAVGAISAAALPTMPAIAMVGSEVAEAIIGSGTGELAKMAFPVPNATATHPLAIRSKHNIELIELYRGLAITGRDALNQSKLLNATTYIKGQARLLAARVDADFTQEELLSKVAKLRQASDFISYPSEDLESLRKALTGRENPPDPREMERYLWVAWIDRLGSYDEEFDKYFFGNTDVLDNDTIENYLHGSIDVLGANSLLGVDFGGWTTEADEKRAVRAANRKWPEFSDRADRFLT